MGKVKTRSPWDGYDPHPLIAAVTEEVSKYGFVFAWGGREHAWFYRWTRPLFPGCEYMMELIPNRSPKGAVDFSVGLGVSSCYYRDVENALRTWECGTAGIGIPAGPNLYADVLRIALHWLLLNADPPVPRLTWSATAERARESAAELGADLRHYGLPFLQQVDTCEKLIALLRNIDSYPKKTPAPGPRSGEASVCAALLLYFSGYVDEAKQELEVGFREDIARYSRTWSTDKTARESAIALRRCKIERYRSFFAGQIGEEVQPDAARARYTSGIQ